MRTILLLLPIAAGPLLAQNATLSGLVTDPAGSRVPNARVSLQSTASGVVRESSSNETGVYALAAIQPGRYVVTVQAKGFQTTSRTDVQMEAGQNVRLDFELKLGATEQVISVTAEVPLVNNTTPTVGTVIDRNLVEKMPVNGRSFQSLVRLVPGVVLTRATTGERGQFSVNGQRANANYFMVDGVSANIAASQYTGGGQAISGSVPALSSLGGTSTLVSMDALQEFTVLTSTFAPEYGRTPGGQVLAVTRSGGNELHGSAYEYLRNDALDANDWIANSRNLARPALRQNNFGGTLGGAIRKNSTFFFGSYESLRLRLPRATVATVPSLALRTAVPAALRPYLEVFPIPNGANFSDGFSEFAASYSEPTALHAGGIRVDHQVGSRFRVFGRLNEAPSDTRSRDVNLTHWLTQSTYTRTLTVGSTQNLGSRLLNDLRYNYSHASATSSYSLDGFGGGRVLRLSEFLPSFIDPARARFTFIAGTNSRYLLGPSSENMQEQHNLVNQTSLLFSGHQLKAGFDYRRLTPTLGASAYSYFAQFSGTGFGTGGAPNPGTLVSGQSSFQTIATVERLRIRYDNFSAFVQDAWTLTPRFTLTFGLRWEVNPAPKGLDDKPLYNADFGGRPIYEVVASPTGPALSTKFYDTTYNNIAPRIGAAWRVRSGALGETVVRGGWGIFYDLGNGNGLLSNSNYPYSNNTTLPSNTAFPVSDANLLRPLPPTNNPRGLAFYGTYPQGLLLPYVRQWNVTVEQGLGSAQAISASYIGAQGRRLLRNEFLVNTSPTATIGFLQLATNNATSDYHAMQVQYRRRAARGLQGLINYALGKSIDDASTDTTPLPGTPNFVRQDRGPSEFDARHIFNAALTYELPAISSYRWGPAANGWSIEGLFSARSAFPLEVLSVRPLPLGNGTSTLSARPDLIPGIPLYRDDPNVPGGRRISDLPQVNVPGQPRQIGPFQIPTETRQGNLGRNALRGFGYWQFDLAVRRQFRLTEFVALQLRAEAFNLLCAAIDEVTSMQRFVAELSTAIEKAEFERSWHSDQSLGDKQPKVEFTFVGRKVSAVIDSDSSERWPSTSFYRTFSAAVRRIDRACNIRWL